MCQWCVVLWFIVLCSSDEQKNIRDRHSGDGEVVQAETVTQPQSNLVTTDAGVDGHSDCGVVEDEIRLVVRRGRGRQVCKFN